MEDLLRNFFSDSFKALETYKEMPSPDVVAKKMINSPPIYQVLIIKCKNTYVLNEKIYTHTLQWNVGHFPYGGSKPEMKTVDENFLAENTLQEVIDKILNIITPK